jgi:hypothetical protein
LTVGVLCVMEVRQIDSMACRMFMIPLDRACPLSCMPSVFIGWKLIISTLLAVES